MKTLFKIVGLTFTGTLAVSVYSQPVMFVVLFPLMTLGLLPFFND